MDKYYEDVKMLRHGSFEVFGSNSLVLTLQKRKRCHTGLVVQNSITNRFLSCFLIHSERLPLRRRKQLLHGAIFFLNILTRSELGEY